jgi:hypothetical protein
MINIAARDLFLNALAFCLLVLIIMIPHLNPPAAQATATPPGNLMVSIAWPSGNTDVDLWVIGPGQDRATGYSNRGGTLWNLLRDDLGTAGDVSSFNKEDAYSRGAPDGDYVINIHGYKLNGPISVRVQVAKADGSSVQTLLDSVVELRPRQEITVVRFRIVGGKIDAGSFNSIWMPLREA